MEVIYIGTPDFAVPSLKSIYDSGANIPLVVTQKDRPRGRGKKLQPTAVKKKAMELGLKVYQPDDINSPDSIESLKAINPDFIVVAAYGQILKREVLSIPKYGCINIHASLLPKYRGAAPINWAIINGEDKTGITIMEMEEGLDSGPILLQESISIGENDNAQIIHDKLAGLASKLITKALKDIKDGNIKKQNQDDKKASYASKLTRDMGRINWNDEGVNIKNKILGLNPWPSAYTNYNGQNMKVYEVDIIDKFTEGKNGQVVEVSKEGIFVNCGDACIVLRTIQMPGKKKLSVEEYLRGNEFEKGVILK